MKTSCKTSPPSTVVLHTRHIPTEHLAASRLESYNERILTTLTPENLQALKSRGVSTVELRLVWWEIEPEPGRFDWSRFERDLSMLERHGLKAGLMAWFNHPPAWYHQHPGRAEFFTCLEHDRQTTTLSPWDPQTLEIMERLYTLTAERYRDRLDFIYLTSCGDYGEPVVPQGVSAYKFSSPHSHSGVFWCGDRHARAAWRAWLEGRYHDLNRLNAAWGTAFGAWNDDLLEGIVSHANSARRLDYMRWLTESTAEFTAKIHRLVKKLFPRARTAVPVGHVEEAIHGQSKSLCVKRLAEVCTDFTARWTGMAFYGEFALSNILARRLSSIARFYGVRYGEETAFEIISPAVSIYECLANGASMIHDDLASYRRGALADLLDKLICDAPVCDTAVFYPAEAEMLECFEPRCPKRWTQCGALNPIAPDCGKHCLATFCAAAAALRALGDYDICDSLMIDDGYLDGKSRLVFVDSTVIPSSLVPTLDRFMTRGGRIVQANNAAVTLLESGVEFKGGERLAGLPRFPEFDRVRRGDSEFITLHHHHVSRLVGCQQSIEIETKEKTGETR